MKIPCKLRIGERNHSGEVGAFEFLLFHESGRKILSAFGIPVVHGQELDITSNTNNDDPPDIEAWGYGIEVTGFPKESKALWKIGEQRNQGFRIPSVVQTNGEYSKILKEITSPSSRTNDPYYFQDLSANLQKWTDMAEIPLREKDVPGNKILILDGTSATDSRRDLCAAVKEAIRRCPMRHIKLIVYVFQEETYQMFPHEGT